LLLSRRGRFGFCACANDRHTDPDDHGHTNQLFHAHAQPDPIVFYQHVYQHANDHANQHKDIHTHHVADSVSSAHLYVHTLAHFDTHADANIHAIIHAVANIDFDSHLFGNAVADAIPFSNKYSMTDIVPFLKSLISVSGLSAYESPVAHLIEEAWKPLVDEISTSRLGSLHGLKKGRVTLRSSQRPSIMIATHMDAIGLIVTQVVDGLIHLDAIGGIDPRILPGTPVVVHGKEDLPGVVVMPPRKTLPEDKRGGVIDLPHLLVDVGLLPSNVARLVQVGDLVSFDTQPLDLAGETLSGHSLDNRASVAALTVCLQELQGKSHDWDVWAVATSQEEATLGGSATSAFELNPDLAVVVDVTFGKGPGANGWETFPLGKGPTLGWGANLHPFLYKKFKELADRLEIPVAMELAPLHSGTDAYSIQVARQGIPTMLLGIPMRYMHTPVEVVSIKDVQRVGRLLSEFISGLKPDFISTIVWEEEDN
jgi:putative aminopeptidase FrvX